MTVLARDIMKMSISTFLSSKIESTLWQECFYKVYKQEKKRSNKHPERKEQCINIINEGITYYNYLLRSIKSTNDSANLCSYQFLIHLGDLNRYLAIEIQLQESQPIQKLDSFKAAESFYQEAIQLNPSVGHSFHQQAVLASFFLFSSIDF